MIKVDLVTGFLGSGKTTFIRRYARHFLSKGQRVGILENDYGAVNVDAMLLQELEDDGCIVESVAGACDADCHRRRFKTKLIALGMSGLDRVIVEPSGIFDVDEFFDAINEEPLDRWYEPGAVIAIVEACLPEKLSDDAEYYLGSQAANAGVIVISKTEAAAPGQINAVKEHLCRALKSIKCGRSLDGAVTAKGLAELDDADFDRIADSGTVSEGYVKRGTTDSSGFCSLCFMNAPLSPDELKDAAQAIFDDPSCGGVFRVKGFALRGGEWFECNATRTGTALSPVSRGQEIIIVTGERLNRSRIAEHLGSV